MPFDFDYLRVVRQLCITIQEGVKHRPRTLTHIIPDLSRIFVGQSIHLQDMTFVCQSDEAITKRCYLDQLGLFPPLFLWQSGRRQVREIREDGKLDGVFVDLPSVTGYNRPVVGADGFRRLVLVQFSHSSLIPTLEGFPKWPPRINISGTCKDSGEFPTALNLNGCRFRRRTVKRRGDKLEWPVPTYKVPDHGIGIQSHGVSLTAAKIQRKGSKETCA